MSKEANGLKLYKIKSTSNLVDNITAQQALGEIEKNFADKEAYFVAYLDYKVAIGCYKDNKFILPDDDGFDPKYIQKIRIFNENQELFIWRNDADSFSGRLRLDDAGERECDVVDAYQVLWGTTATIDESNAGWTKVTEDRGTELVLPFELNKDNLPVKLRTRNYIDYNDAHQAGYVDCRFVGFTDKVEKDLT